MTTPAPGQWKTFSGKPLANPPVAVTSADIPTVSLDTKGSKGLGRFSLAQVTSMGLWMTKLMDKGGSVLGDTPAHYIAKGYYAQVIFSYVNFVLSGGLNAGDYGGTHEEKPETAIPGVGAAESAVNSVSGLIGILTTGETWIRVAEFAVGAMLLGVGFHALTQSALHPSGTANAGKSASKLVGAVPIARAGKAVLNSSSSKSFSAPAHHTRQYSRSGHISHRVTK